jgi:hypothetical protein
VLLAAVLPTLPVTNAVFERPNMYPAKARLLSTYFMVLLYGATMSCGGSTGKVREDRDAGGTGGAPGAGGAWSTGGAQATGGVTSGTGGANGVGGRAGMGGTLTTGGRAGAGGATGAGSGTGTGGAVITGGASGTGGVSSTGGRLGTGGFLGMGGATAAGGSDGTGGHGGATATGGATFGRAGAGGTTGAGGSTGACSSATTYDEKILCDNPVAYWPMNKLMGSEPDLTGNDHTGTYKGSAATATTMPNGDQAADFNGSSQYLTVPSSAAFSIPTTGELTWEAWIKPDVLEFPNDSSGYVDYMGKCADYSPTCEWEARMYNTTNSQDRCNRLSAYAFTPNAGLGSGAYWQATCGTIKAGQWYHVVGEYTVKTQPSGCQNAAAFPGAINIWVNGVPWNQSTHGQTGCMSQYEIVPEAKSSPVNIGTMAGDSWFAGAIAKVAIYDVLLTQVQITSHYQAMTGQAPTGSCASTCSF